MPTVTQDILLNKLLLHSHSTTDVNGLVDDLSLINTALSNSAPYSIAKPPSLLLSRQIGASLAPFSASGSNFTYHTTTTVECMANSFRVCLHNICTVTSLVSLSSIAVSNSIGVDVVYGSTTGQARFTPSTATWVPVTWNGGSASVTLPARLGAGRPSITWSDWIPISTISRTDGGVLPVVMFRFLVPSLGTTNQYTLGNYQTQGFAWEHLANISVHNGRIWNPIRYTGDGITTPANFQPTNDIGYTFIAGFEYTAEKPGITIAALGDSITEGAVNAGLGNFGNGWIWQAINKVRALFPAIPIEYVNLGWTGTTSTAFYTRYDDIVASGQNFDLMIYSTFSPNDGTVTGALVTGEKSRMSYLANKLKTSNKSLILSTPCPNTFNNYNTVQDGLRLSIRTMLLNMSSVVSIVDMESIGDGSTPVRFNPVYTTDGTHPNEVGHGVIADVAVPVISRFIPR